MLTRFNNQLISLVRNPEKKKFLVAVSGGIDSVVMAELFKKSSCSFAIAHCNFQLRGKESEGDEEFVKKISGTYKVPFYVTHFSTTAFASTHKESIQMAARQLRYNWLNEISIKYEYDYIVTAHHADDAIETFFINLLRGTGIAGLHGIASIHGKIIRPLLAFKRAEIEKFAKKFKLKWREDSSNASDKYERNKIRHHLIPELLKINQGAATAIGQTIENLRQTEVIYRKAIEEKLNNLISHKAGKIYIDTARLIKLESPALYLYEYLNDYGFNYAQAIEICNGIGKQTGKVFLSPTYRLIKDRQYLILEKPHDQNAPEISFTIVSRKDMTEYQLSITDCPPSVACLDYDKLMLPLTVRKWKAGDKFYPLGMKRPKKVSDFLIDNKISLADKGNVHVLLSGNDIVWLIGYRIDERFKIVPATKKIYVCKILL